MGKPDPDREWQRALAEHATETMRRAIATASHVCPGIDRADDQGGLTVEIQGPDGEWRRYFVRLTEVKT